MVKKCEFYNKFTLDDLLLFNRCEKMINFALPLEKTFIQ